MAAAKEKSSSRWLAWLAPILFLLAAVAAAVPASGSMAGALKDRAWEKSSSPPESRLDESLQLLNLHQQNDVAGYDDALGSPLAAENAAELPGVNFSASKYPELADNIRNAQLAGHPDVLTYGGDVAANRAAALRDVPNISPLSRDEYPFASSMEGGEGSWVGHVPKSQQNAQGAILKNFYKANNIQPGDQFRVIVGN